MTRPASPRRIALWAGALAALAAVFVLYLRPQFVVTLANQLWNCF